MKPTISIFARVSGNIEQTIALREGVNISPDELVAGLSSGKYATTISHAAVATDCGLVIEVNPFRIIGDVVGQEALEDLEISEYEVNE